MTGDDIVADDVETPDLPGEGTGALRDGLERMWVGAQGMVLTRAVVDGSPSSVAWIPDENGWWSRSRLVTFDEEDGLLTVVAMPEDPDDLERAIAEDPEDEPPDEEVTWPEWDRAEDVRDVTYPLFPLEDDPDEEIHPEADGGSADSAGTGPAG